MLLVGTVFIGRLWGTVNGNYAVCGVADYGSGCSLTIGRFEVAVVPACGDAATGWRTERASRHTRL